MQTGKGLELGFINNSWDTGHYYIYFFYIKKAVNKTKLKTYITAKIL